jgi:hypothetical protein
MTVVTFGSIKGSPGVTTLACLVGATWPPARRTILTECDRSGGDLASRYSLSTRAGWTTLVAGVRRGEPADSLQPHLQSLPGGLEVLVGPSHADPTPSVTPMKKMAARTVLELTRADDLLVDVGRLPADLGEAEPWLSESDAVCIVARSDAASIVHVKERAEAIGERTQERAFLVLVGRGPYANAEVEWFTGLRILAEVPDDQATAAVATTGIGSARRLARSGLVAASRRLATALSVPDDSGEDAREDGPLQPSVTKSLPVAANSAGPLGADVAVMGADEGAVVPELESR